LSFKDNQALEILFKWRIC